MKAPSNMDSQTPIQVTINDIGGEIVKDNETYLLKDNKTLNNLVLSSTLLNPFKQTTGHNHSGQEEVYFFVSGTGTMEVDNEKFNVKPGDVIEIKDASKDLIIIQHTIDTGQDNVIPSWLDVDNKKKSVKINAEPSRGDASSQIEEQLIVELYSK